MMIKCVHSPSSELFFQEGDKTAVQTHPWRKEGHGHSLSTVRERGGQCTQLVDTGGGGGHWWRRWTLVEEVEEVDTA